MYPGPWADPYGIGNEYNLSIREVEIAELLAKGFLNKEVADTLHISINTLKSHIKSIYKKLEVSNKVEMINKLKKEWSC